MYLCSEETANSKSQIETKCSCSKLWSLKTSAVSFDDHQENKNNEENEGSRENSNKNNNEEGSQTYLPSLRLVLLR